MAEERVKRRLAAILAADVVGYSRLMERDETGTLARLRSLRSEVFDPRTKQFDGRIFKNTGDGALAEFGSAVDAVQCAVEIQRALAQRNADFPEDMRIILRIGISLGDVIVEGDDLFGNGVIVAARMEGLAEPGAICVSGNVHEHIGNALDVTFEDLGEQAVKNIDRPVRSYRVHFELAAANPMVQQLDTPPALPDKPSIAVLPFENMSGDPEQEYFSDGITEDIITELSKIAGLFVIARHSSFVYKSKAVPLKQVGRELGVGFVLEGSVRKAGIRLRITAQLIDCSTDHHLWAERFDRDLEDIFAVQEEVARKVADALAVALRPGEGERLAHAPTDNLEAYDVYLQTRKTPWPPSWVNILTAQGAYGHVIEIDPTFVGGYAGKSITHSMAVMFGHSDRAEEGGRIALELAQKAVALDAAFARSHSALGFAYSACDRHEEAVAAGRRAVELQPSDADAHGFLSFCLSRAGHGEEARDAATAAGRLDPQYVEGPYLNMLGVACYVASCYEEAIEAFRRNKARGGPVAPPALTTWTASSAAAGRMEEAREIARELLHYNPDFSLARIADGLGMVSQREKSRLIERLREAGLPE